MLSESGFSFFFLLTFQKCFEIEVFQTRFLMKSNWKQNKRKFKKKLKFKSVITAGFWNMVKLRTYIRVTLITTLAILSLRMSHNILKFLLVCTLLVLIWVFYCTKIKTKFKRNKQTKINVALKIIIKCCKPQFYFS